MELQEILKNIMNTLQSLDIQSTYDNMNKLLGCIQAIDGIIKFLDEQKRKEEHVPEAIPEIDIEEMTVGGN